MMKDWDLDEYTTEDFELSSRYNVKYSLVSNRMFSLDRMGQLALVCKFKRIGSAVTALKWIDETMQIPWKTWIEDDVDDMKDEEIIREVLYSKDLTNKCLNNGWIQLKQE